MKTKEIIQSKLILALNSPDRFTLLEDGWTKDLFTGLDWAPSSEVRMDYNDAVKYCAHKGGRLPEIQELYSLVISQKKEPYTYPILKDTKHDDYYWSGTVTPWNKSAFWIVSFDSGYVLGGNGGGNSYVRPVRVSQ